MLGWCPYSGTEVATMTWGVIMRVKGGGVVTPLSAVRPCGVGSATKWALDTCGSPHLTMGYLPRGHRGGLLGRLKSKSWAWMGESELDIGH